MKKVKELFIEVVAITTAGSLMGATLGYGLLYA